MKTMNMAELKKLASKHGFTADKAAQILAKDGWIITDHKEDDPLTIATKKIKTGIEYRAKASKTGKNGLVEFTVEYSTAGGQWISAKTRRMHPQLVKALNAAL